MRDTLKTIKIPLLYLSPAIYFQPDALEKFTRCLYPPISEYFGCTLGNSGSNSGQSLWYSEAQQQLKQGTNSQAHLSIIIWG